MKTGNDCCVCIFLFALLLTVEQGTVMGSVIGRVYGPGYSPIDSKHMVIGQTPLRI